MSPTPETFGVIAGHRVRVKPEFLPRRHNPREVFMVIEAPAPSHRGILVLEGQLSSYRLKINTDTDALTEKIE
ncbi:hypothetical protein COU96_01795 [Candidatus Shapirobacteria bacterium CG10_big_fil_rev_8_21_14_0_10_38_14]|uniref:Uncharacterized protein n=1 Tax=Candidatus Shapirobacteria bacterium CG10_big_fil_rev_8_21_14_0_10_38_14 TaxID=1974483 RepID=A0A2M8L5F8_9BACT|nr:MAG: hypothetical protein COU96_01795 [Candidatus Shapirobacteria bacterium CG10_big_fil_rev_8_21_14_0_10_38_14]